MPLQNSGSIAMSQIANEFNGPDNGIAGVKNISLSQYYKQATGSNEPQPLDTSVNVKIPYAGNEIHMSDFYGAAWYQGTFSLTVIGERWSKYADADDASYSWKVTDCSSPLIQVIIGGKVIEMIGNGVDFSDKGGGAIGSCDSTCSKTLVYKDCRGMWSVTATGAYDSVSETKSVNCLTTPAQSYVQRI